jgi:glyoxylase-like metal-dependent hydrolase (beta-lactamase superfamily II)
MGYTYAMNAPDKRAMMKPPDDFDPAIGVAEELMPNVRRIVAPNPSPMTYRGTNTYLVGTRDIAVIDPGPLSDPHLSAILDAIGPDQRISHIIVTHAHLDHSPLAGPLSERTGAPTYAFGPAEAGRSAVMRELAASGLAKGGEGIDEAFSPDVTVADGDQIKGADWTFDVLHTPGHIGNHICLGLGDLCFTADHVMGWASSLVSPPDGDLTDFMASCTKLQGKTWSRFFPGHGAPIEDPMGRLEWLVSHRLSRESSILAALSEGHATADQLAALIYTDTPPALLPAATRNVLAHLIDLMGKSKAEPLGPLSASVQFRHIP